MRSKQIGGSLGRRGDIDDEPLGGRAVGALEADTTPEPIRIADTIRSIHAETEFTTGSVTDIRLWSYRARRQFEEAFTDYRARFPLASSFPDPADSSARAVFAREFVDFLASDDRYTEPYTLLEQLALSRRRFARTGTPAAGQQETDQRLIEYVFGTELAAFAPELIASTAESQRQDQAASVGEQ